MEKETRNVIVRATQRARKLLEEDFAAQLEGTFDILRDGNVAAKAAIEHKRAAGMVGKKVVLA